MNIPIRCFTCGKVIGGLWETYKDFLEKGMKRGEALTKIGLRRYCCRTMLLGHVDLGEEILRMNKETNDCKYTVWKG